MLQQGNNQMRPQPFEEADLRLNQIFRDVVSSPCINKPQPGDPPNIPAKREGLRAEETAWFALRDAWTAFLAQFIPQVRSR